MNKNLIFKEVEQLYLQTLKDLYSKIEFFKKNNPILATGLQLDQNNPQFDRMIKSFALIAASLKYEIEQTKENELISLVFNLYSPNDFIFVSHGIIQVDYNDTKPLLLEKNTKLQSDSTIFQTKYDLTLNNIRVSDARITKIDGKTYIELNIEGHLSNITTIDLHTTDEIISSIFWNNIKTQAIVYNRDEYSTKCNVCWKSNLTIADTALFPEQNQFFSLENIDNRGLKNSVKIFIPIARNVNVSEEDFVINCIPVINKFTSLTIPKMISDQDEQELHVSDNSDICNVKKVFVVEGNDSIEIKHISEDPDGWHLILNPEPAIVFKSDKYIGKIFYCEVECYNEELDSTTLDFENYVDGEAEWALAPTRTESFVDKKSFEYIYNYLRSKLSNNIIEHINSIISLIRIFAQHLHVNIEDISITEITTTGIYANKQIPILGHKLEAKINTDNVGLLYTICEELNQSTENKYCDVIFHTISGKFIYNRNKNIEAKESITCT